MTPTVYWQQPQSRRLEQQRRVIVRSTGTRIVPSWKVQEEKAA